MSFNAEFLIPITMFIAIGWVVKTISDNKLRKVAIEKGGVDKDTLNWLTKGNYTRRDNSLKWGMVCIAVGAALIVSRIFQREISEEMGFGLMLVCAGAALVIFHWSHPKKVETKEESTVEIKEIPPEQQ